MTVIEEETDAISWRGSMNQVDVEVKVTEDEGDVMVVEVEEPDEDQDGEKDAEKDKGDNGEKNGDRTEHARKWNQRHLARRPRHRSKSALSFSRRKPPGSNQ